jgi:hypothetical protein
MRNKRSKDQPPSEDDTNVIQIMAKEETLKEVDVKITKLMKNLPLVAMISMLSRTIMDCLMKESIHIGKKTLSLLFIKLKIGYKS